MILQTCYFGYLGHARLWPVKTILPACRKLWYLSSCKKIIFIPNLFLELLQTYYKLVILGTLSMRHHAYQKQSLGFFTDINYTLKNPKIWLTKNILGNNSRTRILPDMGFAIESQESKELSFALFFRKNKLFKKIQNTLFLGPFSSKFE